MTSTDPPATDAAESVDAGQHQRRATKGAYDLPNAMKEAMGQRMRLAREFAGLGQTEASEQLGYSAPVQLSLMESGQRPIPTRILLEAARLYRTTTDYLVGLAEEPDRDPMTTAHREVSVRVAGEVRELIAALVRRQSDQTRRDSASLAAMAHGVLRAAAALAALRHHEPAFDELRGGARLVAALDGVAQLADEHVRYFGTPRAIAGRRIVGLSDSITGEVAVETVTAFLSPIRPVGADDEP